MLIESRLCSIGYQHISIYLVSNKLELIGIKTLHIHEECYQMLKLNQLGTYVCNDYSRRQ